MHRAPISLVFLAALPTLASCGSHADYPSLAIRPAERISGSAEVAAPEARPAPPPLPASGKLTVRLAQLVDQARTAHQRFGAKQVGTERLVSSAAGAAVASDSWSVASIALAELQIARSATMIPLAEVEHLYAAESVAAAAGGNTANVAAAGEARDQINAWVVQEDAVLSRLRGRLRT